MSYPGPSIIRPLWRALFGLLLCLAEATQGAAQSPVKAPPSLGDWRIACTADGYCLASAPARGAAGQAAGELRIGRHAEGTYWEISLVPEGAFPDGSRPVTADVDGQSIAFQAPASIAPFGRPGDFFLLGKPAQALLDRLVPGKALTFDYTDKAGRPAKLAFGLEGLAQALVIIDTTQHRLGSERVAEAPPYGLFRADVLGASWMKPALVHYF